MSVRLRERMAVVVIGLAAACGGYFAIQAVSSADSQATASRTKVVRGPRGPRGFTGHTGRTGATGRTGSPGILALRSIDSPSVHLNVSQSTYDVNPNGFRAQCPAGWAVVGTGFDSTVGHIGFVKAYGTFVGGFIYNDSSIPIDVSLSATCANVPSASISAAPRSKRAYRADLVNADAAFSRAG